MTRLHIAAMILAIGVPGLIDAQELLPNNPDGLRWRRATLVTPTQGSTGAKSTEDMKDFAFATSTWDRLRNLVRSSDPNSPLLSQMTEENLKKLIANSESFTISAAK